MKSIKVGITPFPHFEESRCAQSSRNRFVLKWKETEDPCPITCEQSGLVWSHIERETSRCSFPERKVIECVEKQVSTFQHKEFFPPHSEETNPINFCIHFVEVVLGFFLTMHHAKIRKHKTQDPQAARTSWFCSHAVPQVCQQVKKFAMLTCLNSQE